MFFRRVGDDGPDSLLLRNMQFKRPPFGRQIRGNQNSSLTSFIVILDAPRGCHKNLSSGKTGISLLLFIWQIMNAT